MPPETWDRYKDDPAYRCSYCDAVWFLGQHHFAVVVGRYTGGIFEEFSEPETVYMENKKR
jgi:hypothetical protein